MDNLQKLKTLTSEYRQADDTLKGFNKEVYVLRSRKNELEYQMIEILRKPEFTHVDKMKIEDGSTISIKRPESYTEPWSLSKKTLAQFLQDYFATSSNPNAEECFQYISDNNRKSGTEFILERNIPK